MLKKILENFKSSPLQYILLIITLLTGLYYVISGIQASIKTALISLLGTIPFVISVLILKYRKNNLYKKNTILITNILTTFLIPIFFITNIIFLLILSFFSAINDYPITSVSNYKKVYRDLKNTEIGEYLPKNIPNNSRLFYQVGFLQGGDIFELEITLNEQYFNNNYNKIKEIEPSNITEIQLINPNYNIEDYKKVGYETYYIKYECDDSGYCNHGIDIHIFVREKSREILYYYSAW